MLLTDTFNVMENTSCNRIEGAMYAFPSIERIHDPTPVRLRLVDRARRLLDAHHLKWDDPLWLDRL